MRRNNGSSSSVFLELLPERKGLGQCVILCNIVNSVLCVSGCLILSCGLFVDFVFIFEKREEIKDISETVSVEF